MKILGLKEGKNSAVEPESFEAKKMIVPASKNHVTLSTIRSISKDIVELQKVLYMTDFARSGNWYYDESDNDSDDNTGTCVITEWGGRIKRDLSSEKYILPYWFKTPNNTVFDSIQQAINVALNEKKSVLLEDEYIYGDTEIYVPQGVTFVGRGIETTIIYYGGTGNCLKIDRSQENIELFRQSNVENLTIEAVGNANVSTTATGLRLGNNYGNNYRNIFVKYFYQGTGIHFVNDKIWTEGNVLDNINLRYCKKGIEFSVEGDSLQNGYYSFCNTRAYHVNIVTRQGQTGIKVNPKCHIYGSTLIIKGNFERQGNDTFNGNQVGILVDNAILDENHFDIVFEGGLYNNTNENVVLKATNNSLIQYYGQVHHLGGYVHHVIDDTSILKITSESNAFIGDIYEIDNNGNQQARIIRRKLYTLKPSGDPTNNQKLIITVKGGDWFSSGSCITRYIISSRGGLKINEENFGNKKTGHLIRVFQTTNNEFDVCIETTLRYSAIDVTIELLENFRKSYIKISSQNSANSNYDTTGKNEVTPNSIFNSFVKFSPQQISPDTPNTNEIVLYSNQNGQMSYKGSDSFTRTFDTAGISSNVTYTFPNKSGSVELLNTKTITPTQDGTYQLALGGSIHGLYTLEYTGPSRKHVLEFWASAHQFSSGNINIISDFAYNSNIVFSNLRFVSNPDKSTVCLVVDVSNRNSSTNTEVIKITGQSFSTTPSFVYNPAYSTAFQNNINIASPTPSGVVTLTSGTGQISVTIQGLKSSDKAFVNLKSLGGNVASTWQYEASCSLNTLNIVARKNDGTINTLDNSTLSYKIER